MPRRPFLQASSRQHGAFTLVELLVVIGIIALLIGILLPVLGRARDSARSVASASNIRQQAIAALSYANDHDFTMPYAWWFNAESLIPGGVTTFDQVEVMTYHTALGAYLGGDEGVLYKHGAKAPGHISSGIWDSPGAPTEYVGQGGHYQPNPIIMPDAYYERFPVYGSGAPAYQEIGPAKLNQLNGSDSVMIWESVAFLDSPRVADDGTYNYNSWWYSAIDVLNFAYPNFPDTRYYDPDSPLGDSNVGDPDLGPDFPVAIAHFEMNQGGTLFIANPSGEAPGGSVVNFAFKTPLFRYGGGTTGNVAWSDGHVSSIRWYEKQRHPVAPDMFAISDLQRSQIRIRPPARLDWPKGFGF